MSLTDSMLRGKICQIFHREGVTKSAAEQIELLMKNEQKLLDLKAAPEALGISERQMYRWIKAGKLPAKKIAGIKMVDVSKMSVREE